MTSWCLGSCARSDGKILKQYNIPKKQRDWDGICAQMKTLTPADMEHLGIWAHPAELTLAGIVFGFILFMVLLCVSGRVRGLCADVLVKCGVKSAALRVGVSGADVGMMRKARSGRSEDVAERGTSERNPLTGQFNDVRDY